MNGYEKSYLFSPDDGERCCQKFFANAETACPYTKPGQDGYYWETYYEDQSNSVPSPVVYNHTYYPDLNSGTCVNGTDYPEWMARDDNFKRVYLFKEPEGCCKNWFASYNYDSCLVSIIQVLNELSTPKLHNSTTAFSFIFISLYVHVGFL